MKHLPERISVEEAASFLLGSALKKQAVSGADVLCRYGRGNMLSLRDGEVEENASGWSFGMGLRTIDKEGRQGVAHGNSLERGALEDIVAWSIANCASSAPDEHTLLPVAPLATIGNLELADPEIQEGFSPSARLAFCREMHHEALHTDPRVLSVRSAYWSDGVTETFYASSTGIRGWYSKTATGCGVSVVMREDDAVEMGGYGEDARWFSDLSPLPVARNAVRRTALILGGKPVETGRYDLVLDRECTAAFVDTLGESFLASNIHKGKSLFAQCKGKQAGSSALTLVDDGLLHRGAASSPFDGEGTPRRKTTLMRNGIVEEWLYNLRYASLDGVPSTGNASRSPSGTPDVSTTNLALLPGQWTLQDLFLQVRQGLYVTELLGLHTVNTVTGEFSLGIKGTAIRNGQLGGAVSGMTIAGNIRDILKSIDLVGSDFKYSGGTGASSLVIRDVVAAGM